jgi:hypothetical protein
VLDLSGLSADGKLDYVRRLPSAISAERARYGMPHWVIHDEAQEELWAADTQTAKLTVAEPGICLVTWQPDSLPADVLAGVGVILDVKASPSPSASGRVPLQVSLRFGGEPPREFRLAERASKHVRHQHKYAARPLPAHRRFYFHESGGETSAVAATLDEFSQHVRHCDLSTLDYHLARGDFSRWAQGTLADRNLAAELADIERDLTMRRASDLAAARRRTVEAIARRYQ